MFKYYIVNFIIKVIAVNKKSAINVIFAFTIKEEESLIKEFVPQADGTLLLNYDFILVKA